jgi:hypothetical protein
MTNFLIERNEIIKDFAESEKWKQVLKIKTITQQVHYDVSDLLTLRRRSSITDVSLH